MRGGFPNLVEINIYIYIEVAPIYGDMEVHSTWLAFSASEPMKIVAYERELVK